MNYLDGSEIVTGDAVLIEHGKTTGAVVAVVEKDRMSEFNVDEPGVMIKAASVGLVYVPVSMFEDQGLRFKSRGSKSNLRWIEPR
ncbi:MAG TPA: hypothetical protein VHZ99_12060 [Steroidobacteraceae bacterium]|jgi:hypothetical protein|nr:hypothetical protein [Steroidobacteraceae bacterium]